MTQTSGMEAQKGGKTCTHIADSCCYTAETSSPLSSNYTPIKKKRLFHLDPETSD